MNTRKLVLIEYDENGNEVDCNVVAENKDMLDYLGDYRHLMPKHFLLDKDQRELYTEEQWKIIMEYREPELVELHICGDWQQDEPQSFLEFATGNPRFYYSELNQEAKKFWDAFFQLPDSMQKYIFGTYFSRDDNFIYDKDNKVLERHGIYRAVDNGGKEYRGFGEEKPTLKQAKYYRQKYGCRIVYLSFKDWKEYAVNESELV